MAKRIKSLHTYSSIPKHERLLDSPERPLGGVPSPGLVHRLSTQRAQRAEDDRTDPVFNYRRCRRRFESYVRGLKVVSGRGADFMDSEATHTYA